LRRYRRRRAGGRQGRISAKPVPDRNPDLQRVYASHHLKIHLVLAVDARPAAPSVQTFGLPNRCAAEDASLGKLLLMRHVPSGVWTRFGRSWLRLSIPGHLHVSLVAEEVALAANQRRHGLFMVQVYQVFHVVLGAPLGLRSEKAVSEDAAPNVPVVGFGPLRLIDSLPAKNWVR